MTAHHAATRQVDYDAIPASLAAQAVKPGDPGYNTTRSAYAWPGSPGLLLRPQSPQQVVEALAYARTQNVPLAVRSGGHGTSGRATNDGGIVIDLGALNSIEVVDRERRLVRVGPGARWGDVAQALAPYGLAISSGDHGGVGVGGLATTGGQGFLARSYGLTIDHVEGAEVVLADGRTVRADTDHHPDLFWALRGAGGNMGIVTSLDIGAAEVSDVVYALFVHDASDSAVFLQKWGRLVEDSPQELTAFVTVFPRGRAALAQTQVVWAGDDTKAAATALQPFVDLAPILDQQAQLAPYAAVMRPVHEEHYGQAHMRSRSALLDHLDARSTTTVGRLLADRDIHMFQIRSVGAAVNTTPADATAYAHRTQNFALSATINESRRAHAEQTWTELGSHALYLGFETHGDASSLANAYPPATLARLRTVKAAYDPDDIFHTSFPIPPLIRSPSAGSNDRSLPGDRNPDERFRSSVEPS
jgi:FAD/FMN-containing dehydrogenase